MAIVVLAQPYCHATQYITKTLRMKTFYLFALLVVFVASCAEDDWTHYAPDKAGFSIEMPAQPQVKRFELNSHTTTCHAVTYKALTYQISMAPMDELTTLQSLLKASGVLSDSADHRLTQAQERQLVLLSQDFARQLISRVVTNATIEGEQFIRMPGHEGFAITANGYSNGSKVQVTTHNFLNDKVFYQLLVAGPEPEMNRAAYKRFFESFRLNH